MLDGYWLQNMLFLSNKRHPVNAGALLYYLCSKTVWIFSVQCLVDVGVSSKFPLKHFLLVKPYTMVEKKKIIAFFADLSLTFYFWDNWY